MQILVIDKKPRPEDLHMHDISLTKVKQVLAAHQLPFARCERDEINGDFFGAGKRQLIITVGGDGTLLDASHYIKDSVLFGVNSNPQHSVGSLCVADKDSFERVLKAYLSGDLKPVSTTRIQLKLNSRVLPILAMNDVLVAHKNPAAMARYWIELGGKRAQHKNSGLWISTACGSSGAVASTGGKVQSSDDQRLQWICREPYFVQRPIPSFLSGFLEEGVLIKITSSMTGGAIFVDGPHVEMPFDEQSELLLSTAKEKINWLMTPEIESRRQKIGFLREQYEYDRCKKNAEGGTRTRTGKPGRF